MAADDLVALAEIEMYSDLIIAAASSSGERLTEERIDTVLRVERPSGDEHPSGDERVSTLPRVPQQRVSDEDTPSKL